MDLGEEGVQQTNNDAQQSKASCVMLGYFKDDFIKHFVKKPRRSPPLMNRGYYARRQCIQTLLASFKRSSDSHGPCQVIVLGAGFDTTYFQLKSQGVTFSKYLEIDLDEVVARKCMTISARAPLREMLERGGNTVQVNHGTGAIASPEYCLLPVDLRDVKQVDAAVKTAGLDASVPTFILSECVLVYLHDKESSPVIQLLAETFETAALVIYEQIHPDTHFGQQMVRSMQERGIPLFGLAATPTIAAQEARLTRLGWRRSFAADLNTIYSKHIDTNDRLRVEALELFDEFEEWNLIMAHYCVAVGVNDALGLLKGFMFEDHSADVSAALNPAGELRVLRCGPPLPNAD